MCQLLFAQSQSNVLTRFLVLEGLRQASTANPDGTGIYSAETGIYKVADRASNLRSFDFLNRVGNRALAHVRLASKGIKVTEENAHPFELERWVLAHNGTLWEKEETPVASTAGAQSRDSDSLAFLKVLEKLSADKEASVIKLLNGAMDKFKGKFAFLLYDKLHKKWYAARGKTAQLHISFIYKGIPPETAEEKAVFNYDNPYGYMIMTEKTTVEWATDRAVLSASAITGESYWFTVGTLLEDESIFELVETGAKKIGEIKETPAFPAASYDSAYSRTPYGGTSRTSDGISSTPFDVKEQAVEALIAEWLIYYSVSLEDFEHILLRVLGKPICYLLEEDITWIVETLLPMLKPAKNKIGVLRSGLKVTDNLRYSLLKDVPEMQFPWMLSRQDVIKKAVKVIKKKVA